MSHPLPTQIIQPVAPVEATAPRMILQLAFILLWITCQCYQMNNIVHGQLRPEYGLMFEEQGKMLSSSDAVYLTLTLKIPTSADFPTYRISQATCVNFATPIEGLVSFSRITGLHIENQQAYSFYLTLCAAIEEITLRHNVNCDHISSILIEKLKDLSTLFNHTVEYSFNNPLLVLGP